MKSLRLRWRVYPRCCLEKKWTQCTIITSSQKNLIIVHREKTPLCFKLKITDNGFFSHMITAVIFLLNCIWFIYLLVYIIILIIVWKIIIISWKHIFISLLFDSYQTFWTTQFENQATPRWIANPRLKNTDIRHMSESRPDGQKEWGSNIKNDKLCKNIVLLPILNMSI